MASMQTVAHYSNPKNHWVILTSQVNDRLRGGWQTICVCGFTTRGHASATKAKASWREHLPTA